MAAVAISDRVNNVAPQTYKITVSVLKFERNGSNFETAFNPPFFVIPVGSFETQDKQAPPLRVVRGCWLV